MRRLLIATLIAASLHHAQADTTPAGHSYAPPELFTLTSSGAVQTFTAPEGDTTIRLVELAGA